MKHQSKGNLLRNLGTKQVEENNPTWTTTARATLKKRASRKGTFNFEDIQESITKEAGRPKHPNCIGALFLWAIRKGIIAHVGYKKAQHACAHSRNTKTYVGSKFKK